MLDIFTFVEHEGPKESADLWGWFSYDLQDSNSIIRDHESGAILKNASIQFGVADVPEPATSALLGISLIAFGASAYRRRRSK